MPHLKVLQGPDRGRRFDLPAGEPQLIGRSSEALPISDTTVSRRHAELTPDDGTWYVRDLESANGTFVNGKRIVGRVALSPGDQVRCGATLLLYAVGRGGAPAENPVHVIDEQTMEITLERTSDPNAESIMLGAPDPARAAADHLRVIYELTALTAETLDRPELLRGVMDLIFAEFRPDRGFILLGEDPTGPIEAPVVRYRERPKTVDEGRIPVSRTIVRHVLERGEGVLSTNAMSDTRFRSGDSVRDYGIRSALCVPIVGADRTLGVIHIDSQIANFTFTEDQLLLLGAIGRHTGLALRSAELLASRVQNERLAAIGQTVASLSHSIKNILQGLRGGADAVELSLKKGDVDLAQEGWVILSRNLDRILNLTLNMLAWSRPASLDVELADLHALVREATGLVQPQCDRKRVALMLDLAEDMPPVPIDVNGMHQALVNVLMNAIEAAPAKRGVITVTTGYHADAQKVRVAISDNGPGIEPDRREKLFQAFGTTKGQRGTGLGLPVTRKILNEHGGGVEIQSETGRGTTVALVLPSERDDLDAGDTHLPRPIPRARDEHGF